MIRLPMSDPRWPPCRLRQLRVELLRSSRDDLAAIIGIVDLLARLHKLDVCFGEYPAIDLLQTLERFLIVPPQQTAVPDREHGFLMAIDTHRHHAFMRNSLSLRWVAIMKPIFVRSPRIYRYELTLTSMIRDWTLGWVTAATRDSFLWHHRTGTLESLLASLLLQKPYERNSEHTYKFRGATLVGQGHSSQE